MVSNQTLNSVLDLSRFLYWKNLLLVGTGHPSSKETTNSSRICMVTLLPRLFEHKSTLSWTSMTIRFTIMILRDKTLHIVFGIVYQMTSLDLHLRIAQSAHHQAVSLIQFWAIWTDSIIRLRYNSRTDRSTSHCLLAVARTPFITSFQDGMLLVTVGRDVCHGGFVCGLIHYWTWTIRQHDWSFPTYQYCK